jgi:hypothetical protein
VTGTGAVLEWSNPRHTVHPCQRCTGFHGVDGCQWWRGQLGNPRTQSHRSFEYSSLSAQPQCSRTLQKLICNDVLLLLTLVTIDCTVSQLLLVAPFRSLKYQWTCCTLTTIQFAQCQLLNSNECCLGSCLYLIAARLLAGITDGDGL